MTIRAGTTGQIVHFGATFPSTGGNRIELSGNIAATNGRLLVEGGNAIAPTTSLNLDDFGQSVENGVLWHERLHGRYRTQLSKFEQL